MMWPNSTIRPFPKQPYCQLPSANFCSTNWSEFRHRNRRKPNRACWKQRQSHFAGQLLVGDPEAVSLPGAQINDINNIEAGTHTTRHKITNLQSTGSFWSCARPNMAHQFTLTFKKYQRTKLSASQSDFHASISVFVIRLFRRTATKRTQSTCKKAKLGANSNQLFIMLVGIMSTRFWNNDQI